MLENLTDFFKELLSDQEIDYKFDKLWDEKRKFITYVYFTYCKLFGALLTSGESTYKDRLEELKPFPTLKKPDKKWVEVWLKLSLSYLNNDELQLQVFESFLLPEYEPPTDLFELMAHLQYLQIYYSYYIQHMSPAINSRIDLVALKLTQAARFAIEMFHQKGFQHDRVLSSKKAKALQKAEKAQPILEEYYRLGNRHNLTDHRIAAMIKQRLEKKGKEAPHLDTIKTYIKEERRNKTKKT